MSDFDEHKEELDPNVIPDEPDVIDSSEDLDDLGGFSDDDLEDIEIIPVNDCGIEECEDEDKDKALKQELEEAREEYIRLYAEFDNYKKRTAKDKAKLAKYANESIITELLTSVDNLEIALKHADKESTNPDFLNGVQMTLRELYRTFEKFGVTPIKSEGEEFNPEFHHAVAHLEVDDMDENMVVVELRKGFLYNDKIIRAAMVSVSKKPEESPDEKTLEEATDEAVENLMSENDESNNGTDENKEDV